MSNTCATVMSNNYLTQTYNMNAKVANKMLEIEAGREYLTTKAANEARYNQAVGDLNVIYREGHKIQNYYDKRIAIEDLRSLGMNPVDGGGTWNTKGWADQYVPYNGLVTKTKAGYGGCCYFAGDIDKMACKCGKEKDCGCECDSFSMPSNQSCDRLLNTNIFQALKDRDIASWRSYTDASTQAALSKYNSAKTTFTNTPQSDLIKVDCCQSLSVGDILAKSVTIQGNNLVCNSK